MMCKPSHLAMASLCCSSSCCCSVFHFPWSVASIPFAQRLRRNGIRPSAHRHLLGHRTGKEGKVKRESWVLPPKDLFTWNASVADTFRQSSLVALFIATVHIIDPALAFKGGGPYGAEVTRGLDLSGKDFSGQTLIRQDFKASNLRQVNFKGAKLIGASFFDADLTGADLSDADLRGADFSLANAQKANFTNANLEGALVTGNTTFKGANITGADFTDVLLRDDQRAYLCKIAAGINPVTGNATHDTLAC